jgi:hypothetical protein
MDLILNWLLRAVVWVLGAGAALWIFRWVRWAWAEAEERWPVRVAVGMLLLALLYGAGHARLLLQREHIEAGRLQYVRFGDPRRAELVRADVRGWLLDCTGEPDRALALYREREGVVDRTYPIGEAGANLIGGGADAGQRDFTVERLFASRLREPRDFFERGQLHPAGTDMQLTLCSGATERAWQLLSASRFPGAVVVQDVATGALVAYAATGGVEDAPYGIQRYAPPGSVFKLALAALWWEAGLPDDTPIPSPPRIQVTPRAAISNFGGTGHGIVVGPAGMLIPSSNTGAVWMAQHLRQRLGTEAFLDAYRRYGFVPYEQEAPRDTLRDFWHTRSDAWRRRMSPPLSRVRMSEQTGPAEWAQIAIGQGPVDVTVIGISRFLQAIGNNGVMMRPLLEAELVGEPDQVGRVMPEAVALRLQAAMRAVVDRGTGTAAQPGVQGTGWDIGGKTGTAEVPGRADNGWFAGLVFGPDDRPRYTVVVFLQGGGPGGRAPTQIAGQLARHLIAQPEARRAE